MSRYRVGFSHGGFLIVRAGSRQEAWDICTPMLEDEETIIYVELAPGHNPWGSVPTHEEDIRS
jgi:hypothetical protein